MNTDGTTPTLRQVGAESTPTTTTTEAPTTPRDAEPARGSRLYYVGDGTRWFGSYGVPARDLTKDETAALSDEVYAAITSQQPDGERALYQKSKPKDHVDTAPDANDED